MTRTRLTLSSLAAVAIAAFFLLDLGALLSVAYFEAQRGMLEDYRAANPATAALLYFVAYVGVTALSMPGAAVMTLAGGSLFGFWQGLLLVSFASTIGATLAFLATRFLFRDWVQGRFGRRLGAVNEGIEREGPFYLFALRLVPLFPFWLVNLAMGLTPLGAGTFYAVSQAGMLPGTAVYVYAGTELGRFTVSPGLVVALALLGLFPLVARRGLAAVQARRVYRPWAHARPRRYDYNMVVIGAGSAGLVSAYIAAATKARVALVERHRMGGDA